MAKHSRKRSLRLSSVRSLVQTGVLAILDYGNLGSKAAMISGARKLAQAGITLYQVRAKEIPASILLDICVCLRKDLPKCRITVNDRCDIALSGRMAGVHLGFDDIPASEARRILDRNAIVGLSGGNSREVRKAVKMRPSYISIGPVFGTRTKMDAGRPLGVAGFARLASLVPPGIPVLAVGGVSPDNTEKLIGAGADALAVASWWWRNRDTVQAGRNMLLAVSNARKVITARH